MSAICLAFLDNQRLFRPASLPDVNFYKKLDKIRPEFNRKGVYGIEN